MIGSSGHARSDPADVIAVLPKRSASTRIRNSLISILVVAISLGTGFAASRVWPLPTTSDSAAPDPAKSPAATAEGNDKPSPQAPEAAGPSRAPSATQLTTIRGESDAQKIGRAAAPPEAQIDRASVERSAVVQEAPTEANTHQPPMPVGRNTRSYGPRMRHVRRAPLTGPGMQEFARNLRPNQATRDFMESRSRD